MAVVGEQVADVGPVGCDHQFKVVAAPLLRPPDAVGDQSPTYAAAAVVRDDVEILEFGDQAVLKTETGGGDCETDQHAILGYATAT